MKALTDAEIDAYLATRKWEGCSGAYAIQLPDDPYLTVEEGQRQQRHRPADGVAGEGTRVDQDASLATPLRVQSPPITPGRLPCPPNHLAPRAAISSPRLAALGIGSATFHRAAAAVARSSQRARPSPPRWSRTPSGSPASPSPTTSARPSPRALTRTQRSYAAVRKVDARLTTSPPRSASPRPPASRRTREPPRHRRRPPKVDRPARESDDELAFLPLGEARPHLVRTKKVSSIELTKLYLARLKKYDPAPALRRHAHRGAGAQAGRRGRPGDRRRQVPRPAARHPLGREGPDRLPRLQDDLGRGALTRTRRST